MPKESILDPQGVAVRDAMQHHGLESVHSVRIGKVVHLEFDGDVSREKLEETCRDLLSNPVIEDYELDIHK